jgi:hypothetical protein
MALSCEAIKRALKLSPNRPKPLGYGDLALFGEAKEARAIVNLTIPFHRPHRACPSFVHCVRNERHQRKKAPCKSIVSQPETSSFTPRSASPTSVGRLPLQLPPASGRMPPGRSTGLAPFISGRIASLASTNSPAHPPVRSFRPMDSQFFEDPSSLGAANLNRMADVDVSLAP